MKFFKVFIDVFTSHHLRDSSQYQKFPRFIEVDNFMNKKRPLVTVFQDWAVSAPPLLANPRPVSRPPHVELGLHLESSELLCGPLANDVHNSNVYHRPRAMGRLVLAPVHSAVQSGPAVQ